MKETLSCGYRYPFAYVAFGGQQNHWWTRFLKRGFYHCILILGNGMEWIVIDPVVHYTDLIILKNTDVRGFFHQRGYTLVRTTPRIPRAIKARLAPSTCVETVKRFLGIQNHFLVTPYQLFCFLSHK